LLSLVFLVLSFLRRKTVLLNRVPLEHQQQ
ncbi:FHIPEP family protein, partial [Chlamydia psittaci 84-8471/1]